MSLFSKKDDFDIKCSDRSIKNKIDNYYETKLDNDVEYAYKTDLFVSYGIKYFNNISKWLEIEYEKHTKDDKCNIPDYKTFLSLADDIRKNKDKYIDKTVYVEGYIAYGAFDTVDIYPVPCRSDIEKKCAIELAEFKAFDSLCLIGKKAEEMNYTLNYGTHIKVYGIVNTSKSGGDIIVQSYEVVE
jgi:hypothetical protein